MKKALSVIAMLALLSSSMLLAHDPKKHKGKPLAGTVQELTEKGVVLKTEKGAKTIVFTDKTAFEHGEHKMKRSDVKLNDRLLVLGTTLASGDVVAKEVLWSPSGPQAENKTTHKH